MPILERYSEPVYSIARLVAGALFFCHGAQKLLGAFGGSHGGGTLMTLAGIIELVAGAFIALGLFGSYAAFIASGEMAFAYFKAHAPQGAWPIQNKGELAVVFCFFFLYVAAHGSGVYSLDNLVLRRGWRARLHEPGFSH